MAELNAWGERPMPTDPPCANPELGVTTGDDLWDDLSQPVPRPVTRTAFAMAFAHVAYGTLRWVVLRTGVHRSRKWRH